MEYRNLGRTGVKVSKLCLGCFNFGRRTGEEESIEIISRAMELGVNFIDTANSYGRGSSEVLVGKALKQSGQRNRIVLATKVHAPMSDDDPNAWGNHRRHVIEQCEGSLRRLQTDWIDLYQIHRPQSDVPIDETLRALDDLVRAGKVRYIGTSTFAAWQIVESLWASKELGLNRFVSDQPPYNLLDRRIERELVPMAQTYGLAILPWSPLALGLLAGKYRRGQERPATGRILDSLAGRLDVTFSDAVFNVVERLVDLAREKGCTPSQLGLAWCAEQPGITSPVIGPRTMEHLEDNLAAVAVTVTSEDQAALDEVSPPGRVVSPYYEADFGPHPFRW